MNFPEPPTGLDSVDYINWKVNIMIGEIDKLKKRLDDANIF